MAEENLEVTTTEEVVESKSEHTFTIKDLLEAGVHFGHRTMRWNPKMAPYIYGSRNGIHIIDLTQTALLINDAMRVLRDVAKKKGKILFVCTKKQGSNLVAKMAEECGQYYVTNKWLGGMLTNWKTISQSIRKIKSIENQLITDTKLVKKEKLYLQKQKEKLEKNFNGIKAIGGRPDLIFVIDVPKENLAISEKVKRFSSLVLEIWSIAVLSGHFLASSSTMSKAKLNLSSFKNSIFLRRFFSSFSVLTHFL